MCDAGFNSVALGSSEVIEKLMSNLYCKFRDDKCFLCF